ncbi:MAG: sugar phosphate isomerase/epimerase, partial [Acholeplasmataceae bacterium]|nr:sugar phosphate isomerase/epimerase [Acholeplasmataceae bacterium]
DKIKVFHLKDYIIKDNKLVQVGLGQGLIDYPYVINLIKKHNPDAYLIFEGVKYEDMESSLKYIKSLI